MQTNDTMPKSSGFRRMPTLALAVAAAVAGAPLTAHALAFTPGDLVISVYGDGDGSGTYTDNQAAPITLQEVTTTGTPIGQIVLPQTSITTNGVTNNPISGEYGSSSEGTLQLSGNGQYLTIAGYGVNAATFNANPASFGGGQKTCITSGAAAANCFPLGQTSSVPGFAPTAASGATSTITVPRVVALVGANGSVDTSTALTGVFNENNPRSVATANGSSFYLSGQGASKSDAATQGVFFALKGATTATQVYGTVDTRTVSIQRNQLFLSTDSTEGSGVTENISSIGSAGSLPTTATAPTILQNIKAKFTVTSVNQLNFLDSANGSPIGANTKIYLSPENYFLANATTLYVADGGNPKGDNNGSSGSGTQGLSDGGLQKWSLVGGIWVLDYTLSAGLNLVPDTTTCDANQVNCGTTGLIGLTGEVVGNTVDLFATNATLGDLDQTFLYGIDDTLSATTLPGSETFHVLDTAAPGTNIRGVAFAPSSVPEPATISLLGAGLLGLIASRRRGRAAA
jgi:hypothetical protein